jgi:hypothetical protein
VSGQIIMQGRGHLQSYQQCASLYLRTSTEDPVKSLETTGLPYNTATAVTAGTQRPLWHHDLYNPPVILANDRWDSSKLVFALACFAVTCILERQKPVLE